MPDSTRHRNTAPGQQSAAGAYGDPDEVVVGRGPAYVQVPLWIVFSGVSPTALALYNLFAAHVNARRGDREVWPSRPDLAGWLSLKKASSVDRYITELVDLGAVDVHRRRTRDGMRTRNQYVIHFEPPPGHTGPRTIADVYANRPDSEVPAAQPVVPSEGPRAVASEPPQEVSAGEPVVPSRGPRSAAGGTTSSAPGDSGSPPQGTRTRRTGTRRTSSSSGSPPEQPPPAKQEEEEEVEPQQDPRAGELVDAAAWPAGQRPDSVTRTRLVTAAAACLQAGHSPEAVAASVAAGMPGARHPAGSVLVRLRNLAGSDPQQAPAQPSAPQVKPHEFEPGANGLCRECRRHEGASVHPRGSRRAAARLCQAHDRPWVLCTECNPDAVGVPAPRGESNRHHRGDALAELERALNELPTHQAAG